MLFFKRKIISQHFYAGLQLNIHRYFFQRVRTTDFITILWSIDYNSID